MSYSFSSIRARLFATVLAATTPLVVALGLMAVVLYESQKTLVETDTLQTARALTAAVERDFSITMNVAQALATSPRLVKGDLEAFHAEAKAVLTETFPGFNIVVTDRNGQQILNTLRAYGEPLARHGNVGQVEKVLTLGTPLISDLYIGGVLKQYVLSVDVPVRRGGDVVYVLSIGLLPNALQKLLADQRLPEGQMAAVFDPQGVIAARTHLAEQLVGKKGVPALLQRMQRDNEGIVETRTLEGLDVIIAFSRSGKTGWSVGISRPWTLVLSETLHRITLIYGMVMVLLAAGILATWVIGGKISRSVRALAAPAVALGTGEPVEVLSHGPKEAIEVSRILKTVEGELQLYRDKLETLVAQRTADLMASNRELEQFAYVASHDLQEPLRMVVSYVDLLAKRYGDALDQDAHEFIGFAREGALRMSQLINNLLDYSRIGRQGGEVEAIDLRDVVLEAMDNLAAALDDTAGEIRVADDLPIVGGNRRELVSVFQNLIGNALKYRRPDQPPRVSITAGRQDGAWLIKVSDNGIGIPPEYRERIFVLFQRLHGRHEYPGTGIGLTSAKKIIEMHGGRIWVEDSEGTGSTFCFTLPRK
ncbi:MAG: sensor histidine kinase [Actinomycetota bacterium]